DGEAQPDVLTGRVVLHLVVDLVGELRELDDRVEHLVDLAAAQAQQGGVQVDVVPAGQLAVEAGPQLQQRGDPARDRDVAAARAQDAGEHLQQRRLAGAVRAGQPDRLPAADLDGDVAQGPEVVPGGPAPLDEAFLQAGGPAVVGDEPLADPVGLDHGRPRG